ncbi:MAG: PRC-barrel domain-containing protein [Candidatus Bathyarchaeia archaeon]
MAQPEGEAKRFVKRGDVVGKQVVDNRAFVVGSVRDISFAIVGDIVELGLTVEAGKTEMQIPWTEVQAIGDVVLLKVAREKPTSTPTAPVQPAQPTLPPLVIEKSCLECGYRNPPDAKFCIKCGKKLP